MEPRQLFLLLFISAEINFGSTQGKPSLSSSRGEQVFIGTSVTLRCDMDQSTGWTFYWYRHTQTTAVTSVAQTDGNSYNISSVKVSDGGRYWCRAGRGDPVTQYSNEVWVKVIVRPKAIASIMPNWTDIFSGNKFTLRCDIQGDQHMDWQYRWYMNGTVQYSGQNYTVYSADQFHSGDYRCEGLLSRDQQKSEISEAIRIIVSGG
ncbi:carcinoembryonic antigen-related cell adhesion molecule 6-like [Sardina pilchardus]|uniref:carcinoembryonic antigen-related cell adhesion molecule 6-like n=1 Tax=Sardina pilchardus TaxID=27697 RepID=UPI002E12F0EE